MTGMKKARKRAKEAAATKVTAVIGDVHIPWQDQKSVDLVMDWIRDHQVDTLVLNGDIIDCYQISRWVQPGSPGPGLAEEIEGGRAFLARCREALGPKAPIIWVEGNHCFRFKAYLNNVAPEIKGLDHNVSLEAQLRFQEYGVQFVECPGSKWFSVYFEAAPGVLVGHFNKTSINAGTVAKALLDKYGASVITGHGHCMGTSHRNHFRGPIFGYEGGCLCELDPPYCEPHHWAQGFHVIHDTEGRRPVIERVVIDDHSFVYGGVRYA